MQDHVPQDLISRRYREVHGATQPTAFERFMVDASGTQPAAALGYRRAGQERLFLECYLDAPIEVEVRRVLGRAFAREHIVELGNLAATNGLAMVELWGRVANDLAGQTEVAVATLTLPVRAMFARLGVPIVAIAPASIDRIGAAAEGWGDYYTKDPLVCAGLIAEGQAALARHFARRNATRNARCAA